MNKVKKGGKEKFNKENLPIMIKSQIRPCLFTLSFLNSAKPFSWVLWDHYFNEMYL